MIKTKYSDFTNEEIDYVLKLLKRNTPIIKIKKKAKLSHNEILAIMKKNNVPVLPEQLFSYSINDDTIIITSDNHKGSKYENKKYESLIYDYARSHNIRNIINCGDETQANIEPIRYNLSSQTGAYLSSYPGKSLTTYLLGGNHELRAIEENPNFYESLTSRRDIRFLGLGSAYLLWNNNLISVHHSISKFDLDIPNVPTLINFSGHHHFFKVINNKSIYVPTSSDDIKKIGSQPGFLIATINNNRLIVRRKNLTNEVVEKGVVLTKSII